MGYLKIKDGVDLKELEKFGFKKDEYRDEYSYCDEYYNYLVVAIDSRKVYLQQDEYSYSCDNDDFATLKLYDLIQAGLVEKAVKE